MNIAPLPAAQNTVSYTITLVAGVIYASPGSPTLTSYSGNDAATVINSAITALNNASPQGGVLQIRNGTYTITTPIIVKESITIQGDGIDGTTFKAAANLNANVFTITGANVLLQQFTVNGNKANNTSGSGIEFVPSTGKNEALLLYLQITQCAGSGVRAGVTGAGTYKEIRIWGCNINNNGSHNVDFESTSNDQYVSYCTIASSTLSGIFISSTSGTNIENNQIFQNSNHGILVASSSSINICDNFINNNTTHGISLTSSCFNTIITGNEINGNSFANVGVSDGININNSSTGRILVTTNVCTDAQGTKTQRYGIALAGTSDNCEIRSNSLTGNQTGALLLVGSANSVSDNRGYNSAQGNSIVGLDNRSGVTVVDGSPIVLFAVTAATNGLFRITADIFATAFTSGTATYTITWTENAVTRTLVVTATALNTLGTGTDLVNPDASTNITAQLTGVFTATVKVAGVVEQIA